jgi:hypothetical protein
MQCTGLVGAFAAGSRTFQWIAPPIPLPRLGCFIHFYLGVMEFGRFALLSRYLNLAQRTASPLHDTVLE